ncbi:MAG: type II toxin-antitoxin system RelE/ParE family toxin, partial [Verrucomicrobiaceae bacterium]|nr:type II toxin-antitoxin system RelE/ParE family toxin [Verrucomicrobiaceae bacterium]
MIRQVIFRSEAVEDVLEAAVWYEERSLGLGEELINEILIATDRAAQNPDLFRVVRARGEVRRVLTERFPYRIFFSVIDETLYV